MFYPCAECDRRFGKQYTEECDTTCDYAKAVKEGDRVKKILRTVITHFYNGCGYCKKYPICTGNDCENHEKYEMDLDALEFDYDVNG